MRKLLICALALGWVIPVAAQSYTPTFEELVQVVMNLHVRMQHVEQHRPDGSIGVADGPWDFPRRPLHNIQWGLPGDIPVAGDYDGDSLGDLAVYRPASGEWFIAYSSRSWSTAEGHQFQWGLQDDVPVQRDYDGDGVTDFAVYRPSTGNWYIAFSNGTAWALRK